MSKRNNTQMSQGSKPSTTREHSCVYQNWILGTFASVFIILIAFYGWLHDDINTLQASMISISDGRDENYDELQDSILDLSNRISDRNSPYYLGDHFDNNSSTRNISILSPINESKFNETFDIKGMATVYNGDYIFVISNLHNKYRVSMDCNIYPNGEWEGARPCRVSSMYNNGSDFYKVFAIITNEILPIGKCYSNIPAHSAKSKPIYIGKKAQNY